MDSLDEALRFGGSAKGHKEGHSKESKVDAKTLKITLQQIFDTIKNSLNETQSASEIEIFVR
jgi:hypothetical protein